MLNSFLTGGYAALLLISTVVTGASGEMQKVTDWGAHSDKVNMYIHTSRRLTEKLASKSTGKPPIIVLVRSLVPLGTSDHDKIHPCLTGARLYYGMTKEYQLQAEQKGWILIYPDTTADSHCWNVAKANTLKHDGGGDSTLIANMVRYALKKYNGDPKRVFAIGASSGGMMTNVLMATYPDMFAGGAAFSGVPHACLGGPKNPRGGSSPTSDKSTCAKGGVRKTSAEWGKLVRDAYPGYNGPRPKVQIWHGTTDAVVYYITMGEALKQWSNVLGVSFTRNVTNDPQAGYTKMVYGDGSKLVGYSASGVGHIVPQHPAAVLKFWGLN
jgi:acetylxylan esterase